MHTTLTAARNKYDTALTKYQALQEAITSLSEQETAAGDEIRTLTRELADLSRDI